MSTPAPSMESADKESITMVMSIIIIVGEDLNNVHHVPPPTWRGRPSLTKDVQLMEKTSSLSFCGDAQLSCSWLTSSVAIADFEGLGMVDGNIGCS